MISEGSEQLSGESITYSPKKKRIKSKILPVSRVNFTVTLVSMLLGWSAKRKYNLLTKIYLFFRETFKNIRTHLL